MHPYPKTIQPSHRKALNQKQLQVLYALYKFRFGTEELLAIYTNSGRRYTHERVRILIEQEYIGRRYKSSYRIAGKAARYYLLPKGVEVLKRHPEHFDKGVLRNIRRDVDASDRFARHSVNIFTMYGRLKELYSEPSGGNFHFYTRSYMIGEKAEGFPKSLPDAFASFRTSSDHELRHYLIECFDDTMPQSVMKKRIEQLVDHADSGDWTLTKDYPTILLICETDRLQKNVERWARQELEKSWIDKLDIRATTLDGLNRDQG
jgi:hypothetical protein